MNRPWWVTILIYAILTVGSLVVIYPLLFMILATFASPVEYFKSTFLPVPDALDFRNYQVVFAATLGAYYTTIPRAMFITLTRAVWYVGTSLLAAVLVGYVFARLEFPLKRILFVYLLSGMMVPGILTLVPIYVMLARWPLVGGNDIYGQGGHGFINEWPVLYIVGLVPVVSIFLMKQSYEMFPSDYEEAARIDGAGMLRIIFQVYVPMLRPAITAVAVLDFIGIWNDYFAPLIFIGGNRNLQPLALAVQQLMFTYTTQAASLGVGGLPNFPVVFAGAVVMSIPPVAVYLYAQQYLVQGLMGVGIKG